MDLPPRPGRVPGDATPSAQPRGRLNALLGPGRAARWRRSVLRRSIALVLFMAAVFVVLQEDRTADASATVIRARAALPAGAVLEADAVERVRVPVDSVPNGAPDDVSDLTGRRTTAAIAPGEILTTARVVGPGALDGLPRGRRALALPAVDLDAVRLVAPGDRVDVHRSGHDAPLATDVLVLATPEPQEGSTALLGGGGGAGHVVVAVSPADARALLGGSDPAGGQAYVFAARPR